MSFFTSAIDVLQTLVIALGGGVALIGITLIPLLSGLLSTT